MDFLAIATVLTGERNAAPDHGGTMASHAPSPGAAPPPRLLAAVWRATAPGPSLGTPRRAHGLSPQACAAPPLRGRVSCARRRPRGHRAPARPALGPPGQRGRLMAGGPSRAVLSPPISTTAWSALCGPSWPISPAGASPAGWVSGSRALRGEKTARRPSSRLAAPGPAWATPAARVLAGRGGAAVVGA
jgi:hypothetical protein